MMMTTRRAALPVNIPVSIVIGTRDRPRELLDCLRCLSAQATGRRVEVIVVDNNPSSGQTPPVVAGFPRARLIREHRQGVAYARNAGILASGGEIIVTVDDDVTMPPDWLENLLSPFTRSEVMAVTGNVLPFESETAAARIFEMYGGLGRGIEPFEVGGQWFNSFRLRAVPVWELGVTANAAFRARVFSQPGPGLMNEMLGPGTPVGGGEDNYLFYRLLKAGYTLVYEPAACIRHKHRRTLPALHRQIYDYSKSHVAYHLLTLLRDRDLRAVVRLTAGLPLTHLWRIARRLRRRSDRPLLLITLIEIAGNLAGPWSLWRSYRRVKRESRGVVGVSTTPMRSTTPSPEGL